jgi:hypothetical protein
MTRGGGGRVPARQVRGGGSGDSIELYRMYGEVGGGITPNSTHT